MAAELRGSAHCAGVGRFQVAWKFNTVIDESRPDRVYHVLERRIWEAPGLEICDPYFPILSNDAKDTLG